MHSLLISFFSSHFRFPCPLVCTQAPSSPFNALVQSLSKVLDGVSCDMPCVLRAIFFGTSFPEPLSLHQKRKLGTTFWLSAFCYILVPDWNKLAPRLPACRVQTWHRERCNITRRIEYQRMYTIESKCSIIASFPGSPFQIWSRSFGVPRLSIPDFVSHLWRKVARQNPEWRAWERG